MKSFEDIKYNTNSLFSHSDLGNLNVEKITKNGVTENFGIDFYNTPMENNYFIPVKSFHTNYIYYLSFMDHKENIYTRIYYMDSIMINVNTCYSDDCISCWEDYNRCDNCNNGDYALLRDHTDMCYKTDKIIIL